jgi:3-hydroxyisobutyrate dehydrogenase-like beta-hydroxyacid dehydrogenase
LGFPAWRYLAEHAAGRSTDLPVLTAARSIFDALCETGLGSEHISAAFKAYHR